VKPSVEVFAAARIHGFLSPQVASVRFHFSKLETASSLNFFGGYSVSVAVFLSEK
jgi:hypothetical protein